MYETQSLGGYKTNDAFLAILNPEPQNRPIVDLQDGKLVEIIKRVHHQKPEYYWCVPGQDMYRGIPLQNIHIVDAIRMINQHTGTLPDSYVQDKNGTVHIVPPDAYSQQHENAIEYVLDELSRLRPHDILGAESHVATKNTLHFLKNNGYSLGEPRLRLGEISYLGTYKTQDYNVKGIGTNGVVIVTNTDEPYVGPTLITKTKKSAGNRSIFNGISLLHMTQNQYDQFSELWLGLSPPGHQKIPTKDSRLNELIERIMIGSI